MHAPLPLLNDDEDAEFATASARTAQVLDRYGLTAQDLLDELPAARDEAMRHLYGDELIDDLERFHRAPELLECRLVTPDLP